MQRILFCPPLYPPAPGGSQALFSDLAQLWCQDGGSAVVYTTGEPDPDDSCGPRVRRFAQVTARHPRLRARVLGALSHLGPLSWRCRSGFPHWRVQGYREFLRSRTPQDEDGPFDLVVGGVLPHTHFLEPALRFAAHHSLPFVCVPLLHTGLLGTRSPRQVLGPGAAPLLRRADAVVALTGAELGPLARLGVAPQRLHVLGAGRPARPPAAAASCFAQRHGLQRPYLLQAGALAADKGTLTLLHAMRLTEAPAAPLVLMGRASGEVHRALADLPPDRRTRIVLLEDVAEQDWQEGLAGAAALVHPSRADSLGFILLEAWRAGVPVLAAAAGGPAHLLRHGTDGLLVPADDAAALAAAMGRILADADLATRLGDAGRERFAGEFTWDSVYPRWRQLFLETAAS